MIQKYFKKSALLGLTELLLALKGLILIPILTKTFGSVNYGIWAQVTIIVSMLSPLAIMGLDSAFIACIAGKDKDTMKKAFSAILLFVIFISIAISIPLIIFSQSISALILDNSQNSLYIVLAAFVILETILLSMCKLWYRINEVASVYAIVNIIQAFSAAILAAVVAFSNGTIFELIFVTAISEFLIVIILLLHIVKKWGYSPPDFSLLSELVIFGVQVLPVGYAMWILTASNRLFLGYYETLAAVGVFSVAYNFGYTITNMLFGPIWVMYPPKAAELFNQKKMEDLQVIFNYSIKAALGLMIPAVIGFSLLGSAIFALFTSPEFSTGAQIVPFIALGFMFHLVGSYFVLTLGFVRRQIYGVITIFAAAGLNIILNILLIPVYGIYGAAIALCLSFAAEMLLEIWLGNKYLHYNFDWIFLGKTIFSTTLMGGVVLLSSKLFIGSIVLPIILGFITYLLTMIIVRSLQSHEMNTLLEMLHVTETLKNYPPVCKFLGVIK